MKRNNLKISTLLLVVIMFTGFLGLSANLQAQSIKPVTVQSSKDFEGTKSAIKKAVSGGGMQVMSEMDQGNMLSMTGLSVKVHTFFIGNPNVGKEAFSADPSVGLVIPVRVNVYEGNGKTYVSYFKPSEEFASFDNQKVKMIGDKLDGKLQMMMKMISK
ncbi:DUF302 domain-containing protein [Prolixibacter sp. SD074]|jgi:uncharacterized protein (DUF302 family)|uniref:DUF302 domain-containing protein n=1 Tax=Prolixibacter sp. SD074 TaxID=2652391 RepID=UPI001272353C|nr:DUF302 domain-containing protein [Prolixibacter sp. SD074]GET28791.1 hypothetical protein SD074_09930 [Prolixibacter sp. SD074]